MNEEISMIDLAKKLDYFFLIVNLENGKITTGSPHRRIPDMKKP